MKTETYIKNEIIRLTTDVTGDCWAMKIIDKMVDEAFEFLAKDPNKNVNRAIFNTIDQYH